MKRYKLPKGKSKRSFRATSGVKAKNFANPMRGGIRL